MLNFNTERLGMAALHVFFARMRRRGDRLGARAKGVRRRLAEQQVIRHKIVDMAMRVNATQAYLEDLAWRVQQRRESRGANRHAEEPGTQTMGFCA